MTVRRRDDIHREAVFDESGAYRYLLRRSWPGRTRRGRRAVFILLNPSTADQTQDDPTVRRCINWCRNSGFARLDVLNIFALRSTDPRRLREVTDPVGPGNDEAIRAAVRRASLVLGGWGNHGLLNDRWTHVLDLLAGRCDLRCFGVTGAGQPRHPLYMKNGLPALRYPMEAAFSHASRARSAPASGSRRPAVSRTTGAA